MADHLEQGSRRTAWGVRLLAWICILFGLIIGGGGAYLLILGGSWYYAVAGVGLIATGFLLVRGSMLAVWLYLAVWVLTAVWAWGEVGADVWGQVPRLLSPTVILLLILACIPALRRSGRRVRA